MKWQEITKRRDIKIIMFIVLSPLILIIFQYYVFNLGLIGLFFDGLYYLPLGSWMQEPFFKPDSELGFIVLWPGRFLTGIIYTFILLILSSLNIYLTNKKKLKSLK